MVQGLIMDDIVNVAQISVAVMQFSVAAALAGAAVFSAWAAKHQEQSNVEESKVYRGGCDCRTRY